MERVNPFRRIYDYINSGDVETKLQSEFPVLLDLEPTNHCNLHCLMCPTGSGASKRERGFMAEEIFSKILSETQNQQVAFHFVRWGEPLLHPQILDFIRASKADGHLCHITTNGFLLAKIGIDKVIESGLDSIKFSFQGVDNHTYGAMRQGGDFNSLLSIIRQFHAFRGDRASPFIHVTTSITQESQAEAEAFRDLISPYTDTLMVGRTKLEHIDPEKTCLSSLEKQKLQQLKQEESMVRQHFVQCPFAFDQLSIGWDGLVNICGRDYDNQELTGDLRFESISTIWKGERRQRLVGLIKDKKYDQIPICQSCFDFSGLQTSKNIVTSTV